MRKPLFFLLLLSGFSMPVALAAPHDQWSKGTSFYQQKQYDSAAYYFEQLAVARPSDATLYYNLGNTYYRLNKSGLAILNYQRALKRKPAYKEASDNLLLAQSRIPGGVQKAEPDIFFLRWWKAVTAPGLIMLWSVMSLLLFIGLIGLLLYRRLKKGQVVIRPQYIGALTLFWMTALLLAFTSAYAALRDIKAVVIAPGISFTPNDPSAKYAGTLPEGTTVTVRSQQADTYEVETADGRTGFIPKKALGLVD